jgi:nicotinate dehydrogenase subunit A
VTGISFTVNGRAATASINSADTLLHVLRNHADLKGTRYGCGIEECGACMVLVNGKPTFSCTFAAQDIDGQTVTTVEGLARNDRDVRTLHPVQRAFLDEQAGQCGYCLSGIMISATALLEENPDPGREQIVAALEPHLCRCGAHIRMLRAVERAAQIMRNEVAS